MKENSHWECTEAEDKCSNMIRTMGEDQAWQDIRCGNQILSRQQNVIAITHQNGTHSMLTSAKLSVGYLVVGITRKLNKKPSLHCSSIYINTTWSVLQQYLLALISMHHPHIILLIHYKATMLYTCALISYS